jgi:hypothetical protein
MLEIANDCDKLARRQKDGWRPAAYPRSSQRVERQK